jgi:hypothetical protein
MTYIRTKTPAGEPIVILPEAEFERLRELAEDAEDAAIIARSQAALACGGQELLTSEEVDVYLRSPTPLAFWREKRGLSHQRFGELVGLDDARVAAIERGAEPGDLRFYRRAAEVLKVTVDDLLPNES